MSYTVGQIVYLLSKKDVKVFPAQIIEEIKRKTISEEMISYIVKLPDKDGTEVLIDEITAEVFTSIEDLEKKMLDNASRQIRSFLDNAKKLESVFVKVQEAEVPEEKKKEEPKKRRGRRKKAQAAEEQEDKVSIDLGNGMTAKMSMSEIDQINV